MRTRFSNPLRFLHCTVDLDGEGTSSATPQVAAAALLWLTQHKHAFDAKWRGWERVEMVRKALFEMAGVRQMHYDN